MLLLRRLNRRLIPTFATILGVAGTHCASLPSEGTEDKETRAQVAQAVTGGTSDDGHASAVWMVGKKGNVSGYCSAVVISPYVALTAGHCVTENATYSLFLGADYNDAAAKELASNFVAVTAHRAHPKFKRDDRDSPDLGVLITREPIPREPALVNRQALVSGDRGTSVAVVGFGQVTNADKTIGRRRQGTATLENFDDSVIQLSGSTSCYYDSGGPTFATRANRDVVIGIHFLSSTVDCTGDSLDTRVDSFLDFIDESVAAGAPHDADAGDTDAASKTPPPTDAGAPEVDPPAPPSSSCAVGGVPAAPSFVAGFFSLLAVVLAARGRRKS